MFGGEVANLVEMLTDVSKPSDGNRKIRKAIDCEHTAKASPQAKTIKLADLIDNTKTIVAFDPEFAKIYLAEKRLLLDVLVDGDKTLFDLAMKQIAI
jgi:(p)ppGpp synthase/HD superfamily hydrolase